MKKVVYNGRFGGFGFSLEGLMLLHILGLPMTGTPLVGSGWDEKEFDAQGPFGYRGHTELTCIEKDGVVYSCLDFRHDDALRSHPVMLKVIELLGARANGPSAALAIAEVPDDMPYRIHEYEGCESVIPLDLDFYVAGFTAVDVPVPSAFKEATTLQFARPEPSGDDFDPTL